MLVTYFVCKAEFGVYSKGNRLCDPAYPHNLGTEVCQPDKILT